VWIPNWTKSFKINTYINIVDTFDIKDKNTCTTFYFPTFMHIFIKSLWKIMFYVIEFRNFLFSDFHAPKSRSTFLYKQSNNKLDFGRIN
jgi:hypothetical protein